MPNCGTCADLRRSAGQADADSTLAELARRQQWRAAVDACDECDENGKLELPDGSLRRHHEFAEAVS